MSTCVYARCSPYHSHSFIYIGTHTHKHEHNSGLQLSGALPPQDVKQNLLLKFSEALPTAGSVAKGKTQRRKITNKMKDKILLHLLVLTLIVDDFSVDCSDLQKDLKLTTKKFENSTSPYMHTFIHACTHTYKHSFLHTQCWIYYVCMYV